MSDSRFAEVTLSSTATVAMLLASVISIQTILDGPLCLQPTFPTFVAIGRIPGQVWREIAVPGLIWAVLKG